MATVITAGTERRVNATTAGEQTEPVIAALDGGGYVVVWTAIDQGGLDYDIHLQRFGADGLPVGAETRVNTTTAYPQYEPAVAAVDGGFVVVWSSLYQDGSGLGVFAQRYDADGLPVGGETQVNEYTTSDQFEAAVARVGDGFVVTWGDSFQDGSGVGLYARRFDGAGAAVGGEIAVSTYTDSHQVQPVAVELPGEGFALAWASTGQDGSDPGVYLRRFDGGGAPLGPESLVNTTTAGSQRDPVMARLADGGLVVAWYDWPRSSLVMQLYDAAGGAVGSETAIGPAELYLRHDITALSGGGFLVTWSVSDEGASVLARRYDSTGGAIGSAFKVNAPDPDAQYQPQVAALPDGGFVVAWRSDDSIPTGTDANVYSRIFTAEALVAMTSAVELVEGTAGDDLLLAEPGALGPGDQVSGLGGVDTIGLTAAGTLDLTAPTAIDGIEAVAGSSGDDTFVISQARLAGVASIAGGDGTDRLRWATPQSMSELTRDLGGVTLTSVEALEGSSVGETLKLSGAQVVDLQTIDGGAGTDTLLVAGPGAFDLAGATLTGVERLLGSAGDDVVTLEAAAAAGLASIGGGLGTDTLALASSGALDLRAFASFDGFETVAGSAGDDVIVADAGRLSGVTALAGGGGTDALSLVGSVDLSAKALSGFEKLQGSSGAFETFTLTRDQVAGLATIDGGAGSGDNLSVATAGTLDLSAIALAGIEGLSGSSGDDAYTVLAAQVAGLASMFGGSGADSLQLAQPGSLDLRNLFSFSGFESVLGSSGDDAIASDASRLSGVASLSGGGGTDTLTLAGIVDLSAKAVDGFEALLGSAASDALTLTSAQASGFATIDGGGGADTLALSTAAALDLSAVSFVNVEGLRGSSSDDSFTLTVGQLAGMSTLIGGAGVDTLQLADSGTLNLLAFPTDSMGGSFQVERILGSAGADVVIGDGARLAGVTTLSGGAGADALQLSGSVDFGGGGFAAPKALTGFETITGASGGVYGFDLADLADATTLDGGGASALLLNASAATADLALDFSTPAANGVVGGTAIRGFGRGGFLGSGFVTTGSGNDTLTGGAGSDALAAGAGNDVLRGGAGGDNLNGGEGNDRLEGGADSDTLSGGDGDDSLDAGTGFDTLLGGAGDDELYSLFAPPPPPSNVLPVPTTRLDGGAGVDLAVFDRTASGRSFSVDIGDPASQTALGDGTVVIGIERIRFEAGGGNDTLSGGALSDTLSGGAGRDALDGRGGDDTLVGGAGIDLLTGGDGNDSLDGGDSADTLDGEAGFDTLLGGAGADTLYGGADADRLDGGASSDRLFGDEGDDSLDGGAGVDELVGGEGDDRYVVDDARDVVVESAGEGFDAVVSTVSYALSVEVENLTLLGSADLVGTGNEGFNVILGGGGADRLLGLGGNDRLDGGAGNDTLDGGSGYDYADYARATGSVTVSLAAMTATGADGSDVLVSIEGASGSAFADSLLGGSGDDNLHGAEGDDTIVGGGGADTLTGAAGADSLLGGAGADFLWGFTGNDTLDGGAGDDLMLGGVGDDAYLVNAAGDQVREDLVAGVDDGGLDTVSSYVSFTLGAFVETLRLLGSAALDGTGNEGANVVTGNGAANVLLGLGGDDVLDGGAGNDSLAGGAGADTLTGGRGIDTLEGGEGADLLRWSFDADRNDGGSGIDTVEYSLAPSAARFALDNSIASAGSAAGDSFVGVENAIGSAFGDVIVGDGGANRLNGGAGDDSLVGGAGADRLEGAAGADTLSGGLGNDDLVGGLGADSFRFDAAPGAAGIDRITDFSAVDDQIVISAAAFGGGLTLGTGTVTLVANADPSASGPGPQFLYDTGGTDVGVLSYDADGQGGAAAIAFARLPTAPGLTAADFMVVA